MRRQLKRVLLRLLRAAGAEGRALRGLRRRRPLTILNLHQVRPDPNPFWSPLPPALFEELLRFVGRHFTVTTFRDLPNATASSKPPLILSFDDGYYDYLEYAVPLLERHRIPSNQNVIGASLVDGSAPAVVRVCDFLGQAPRSLINEIVVSGFVDRLRSDDEREKVRFGMALCNYLKLRPRAESAPMWESVERTIQRLDSFRPSRMMTVDEVRQISSTHEIGAHSYSHDSMEFETDETFADDFRKCADVFSTRLHLPLTIYAFPNGSSTPTQVEWVRKQGVVHVLLVNDRRSTVSSRLHDRINFYAASRSETRLRALGFFAARD